MALTPKVTLREAALAERNYPTADEREAFRYGWSDGWAKRERDEDYKDYPNAYSAGYWEAYNHGADT
jgi:hypothetical protein